MTTTSIYINERGTKLSVRNGMFCIRKPHAMPVLIPVHEVRQIALSRAVSLTTDVLFYAAERQIDIVADDSKGRPVGRWISSKANNIATLRKNQLEFAKSEHGRRWIADLIREKIKQQVQLIEMLSDEHNELQGMRKQTCVKLKELIKSIHLQELMKLDSKAFFTAMRNKEAQAAKRYWKAVNYHLPAMYRFEKRTKHPAKDIFNAVLNYVYGILYRKIESALIYSGFDINAGLFHADEHNKPVLVFDVIELFRHWADYCVIFLFQQFAFDPADFNTEKSELSVESRKIAAMHFNDFMQEIIEIDKVSRSRDEHIYRYAESFAKTIKNHKP